MCTHTQKGYFLFSIELLVERFGQQSRKLRWFFAWPCQYTPGYNINTRGISAPLLSSQTQEVQCLSTSGETALCIPIPHLVVPAHPGMWNDSKLSQFSIFKAMYTRSSLRGRSDMKKIRFCLKDWKLRVNRIKNMPVTYIRGRAEKLRKPCTHSGLMPRIRNNLHSAS